MSKRVEYLDIAKGIGIYLMILGHSYTESNGTMIIKWLYSFHMPLFFLISGILYASFAQNGKEIGWNWKKKLKTLILPYLVWNSAYQIFLAFLRILGGATVSESARLALQNVLSLDGSAMWFLPVMFLAEFLFLTTVHSKIGRQVVTAVSVASVICMAYLEIPDDQLARIMGRVLVAVAFIELGFLLSSCYLQKGKIYMIAILAVIHLGVMWYNPTVSVASLTFGNPVLYFVESCAGTYIIIQISQRLEKYLKLFSAMGRDSLHYLCLHGFVIQIIRLLDYKITRDLLPRAGVFEGLILSAIIISLLSLGISVIYAKKAGRISE